MMHPALLNRVVSEGSELGNHSFTHPNLSNDAPETIRLELNSTRRLVEAYTGRSMRLFRAPYFGDAEPTTSDELYPALAKLLSVLWDVDTVDWTRPSADQIVQSAVSQAQPGSIILLHDGGGDRASTIAAIPRIVKELRAKGYEFATVGDLVISDPPGADDMSSESRSTQR